MEVSQQGIFKLPTVLPIDLSTYRFLGGTTGKDDRYLLLSDTYSLGDYEYNNRVDLGKMDNDQTYVRIFLED